MTEQVTYLMSGPAYLPYLAVSAYTLRRYWKGPVEIHAYPKSFAIAQRIADDPNIKATCVLYEPDYYGKNNQFINKIQLTQSLKCDVSLYLDADTIIAGSLDRLFDVAGWHGIVLTQFNKWVTTGGIISKRIKRLIDREPIEQDLVQRLLSETMPSVNGGVWAAKPSHPALQLWYDWTWAVRDVFIADETVLHAVMLKHNIPVLWGGQWNMSPKHRNPSVRIEDVLVWHFHGNSCVRPQKEGVEMWWPVYQECVEKNIGGIAEWKNEVGNKYLNKLEPEMSCTI